MSLYDDFVLKLNILSHQCCVICSLEGAQTTVSSRLLIKVLNRTTLRRQHCSISFVFNIQMEHNTLTSHPYNDPSEPGSTIFWFSTYPDYNILSWNARILWKTELKAFERCSPATCGCSHLRSCWSGMIYAWLFSVALFSVARPKTCSERICSMIFPTHGG